MAKRYVSLEDITNAKPVRVFITYLNKGEISYIDKEIIAIFRDFISQALITPIQKPKVYEEKAFQEYMYSKTCQYNSLFLAKHAYLHYFNNEIKKGTLHDFDKNF